MESLINEIEFDFDQRVSIRTDVKLSKDDVKQIITEAPVETLEEIAIEGKKSFKENGGRDFHMVECLNDSPQHIQMLKKLVDPYIQ
mgnify:CR=1 FL=1